MNCRGPVIFAAAAIAVLCSGCYRLRMSLVDASVQKPSNVALYFAIDDRNGYPVAGIKAKEFEIFRGMKPLPVLLVAQHLLSRLSGRPERFAPEPFPALRSCHSRRVSHLRPLRRIGFARRL